MIPKTIHQVWLGGAPPPDVERMVSSIKATNPSWDHVLWTDDHLPALENRALFNAATSFAMKADILRYEILAQFGGVYLDADFEAHRPIDPIFRTGAPLVLVSEFGVTCNSVIGCIPGHSFMRTAVRALGELSLNIGEQEPHLLTGPYFLDSLFVREGLYNDPTCLIAGDFFFPPRTRVERSLREAKQKRYLTHVGMASWRRPGVKNMLRRTKLRTRTRRFFDLSAE